MELRDEDLINIRESTAFRIVFDRKDRELTTEFDLLGRVEKEMERRKEQTNNGKENTCGS